MARARSVVYRQSCLLCGETIKQNENFSRGLCVKCYRDIMRRWSSLPVERRIEILEREEKENGIR